MILSVSFCAEGLVGIVVGVVCWSLFVFSVLLGLVMFSVFDFTPVFSFTYTRMPGLRVSYVNFSGVRYGP